MKKQPPKKKYRALKKTEIAVDVVKFAAYKKPDAKPYYIIHSDNPEYPIGELQVVEASDGKLMLIVPMGDTIEQYDIDAALA